MAGIEEGGFKLSDQRNEIPLDGSRPSYQHQPYPVLITQQENYRYPPPTFPYTHPAPFPGNYANSSTAGPSYPPPRTPPPPPPPPPSNVGFIPTFLPGTGELPPAHYINMPSSNTAGAATRHGSGPGFGMGVGAGALAAGAVIFGDDFMSGLDFPAGFQGGSLTISADPPF